MKILHPTGGTWRGHDLRIGDAVIFRPKGKDYSLGGVLTHRLSMMTRALIAIDPVLPDGASKDECVTTFYDDEIEIVARYSTVEDLAPFKELLGGF